GPCSRTLGPSTGVALLGRRCEHQHADEANRARHPERARGRELPEQAADESGGRDRQTADEIVQPDGAGADRRLGEIDDERLARWFPELTEAADDEGEHEG